MGYGCPCFCLRRGKKMKHEDNKGEKNVNFQCEEPRMATGFSCETNVLGSLCATGFLHEQFHHKARAFTYGELEIATRNFRTDYLIGEGGFGFVFKGQLQDTGQVVAVKRLNQMGLQGNKEFMVEVSMLSLLRHPNLVNMIGFCAEGDQRLLVYELLPLGSLEDRLHDLPSDKEPLDWNTRMRIADGTAKGLDYLHNKADPPVIYRDLKSSNILLGEGFHPKLSDFGLAKFGPSGDKTHVSTRIMGTHGYCAPEYISTGKLTTMSDIYSFGVLLLELITGYRAYDSTRARGMEQLVDLARPMLKDLDSILQLADPRLKGKFPKHILLKAVELAAMCLQEKASSRPFTADVALATNYLISYPYDDLKKEGRTSAEEEVKRHLNKDGEREKAVAEAKMWGVHWRKEIAKCPQSSSNDL